MSDRYLLDSGDYYCVDCGSVVRWLMRPKHDAFHDRIDLMYDAIPASLTPPDSNDSVTAALEPPVGSVVRCEGCGNVFVRKADGWVNTDDDSRGLAWVGLAAPACGPLRVIYRPGGER